MSEVKISAELRTEFGKGGARRTRRAGKVPAVLYGHGAQPKHIALPAREFAAAIRQGGMTQVLHIDVDGDATLALPKAIQRDPVKDTYEHVDLVIVKRGERVTLDVPVQLTGVSKSGTLVVVENASVSVVAEALHVPEHLDVSIAGAEAGTRVTAGQLTLPSGVELAADPDLVLAMVTAAQTMATESGESAEAEAGAEV
ncbi:50S ribosomal protein L25 [Pilimelia terevasa]|uniref:Large ribosomal subunit protein bL25 n=1 Tax=Pilimelia terevasa TaxID=53372 RepID=A0A8J3BUT8_9ACTN|nr:50S ribosomal protein L25/general stress protein Ctc [Pilimelia terevasa]GGK30747.1 50S ribosomal protein L25 [Pilimelia terevasa]